MRNSNFRKTLFGSLLLLVGSLCCMNNNSESYRVESKPKKVIEKLMKVAPKKEANEKYTLVISDRKPSFIGEEGGIYILGDGLRIEAADWEGENPGLEKIILYEEVGKETKIVREFDCGKKMICDGYYPLRDRFKEPGERTYFAKAIDKGGNQTTSKKISVKFVE